MQLIFLCVDLVAQDLAGPSLAPAASQLPGLPVEGSMPPANGQSGSSSAAHVPSVSFPCPPLHWPGAVQMF